MSIAEQAAQVVTEALSRPFVAAMPENRRTHLVEDLRACADRVDDAVSLALLRETVERRLAAEEQDDELDELSDDEAAEIERRSAEAAARPDRLLPWEAVFPRPRLAG